VRAISSAESRNRPHLNWSSQAKPRDSFKPLNSSKLEEEKAEKGDSKSLTIQLLKYRINTNQRCLQVVYINHESIVLKSHSSVSGNFGRDYCNN
jgi:hypothetical protein